MIMSKVPRNCSTFLYWLLMDAYVYNVIRTTINGTKTISKGSLKMYVFTMNSRIIVKVTNFFICFLIGFSVFSSIMLVNAIVAPEKMNQ